MRPASVLCLYVKFWQSRSPSNHQKIRQAIPNFTNFTQIRHFFNSKPEFQVRQTFFMSEHAVLRPNVEIISAKLWIQMLKKINLRFFCVNLNLMTFRILKIVIFPVIEINIWPFWMYLKPDIAGVFFIYKNDFFIFYTDSRLMGREVYFSINTSDKWNCKS